MNNKYDIDKIRAEYTINPMYLQTIGYDETKIILEEIPMALE